MRMSIDKEPGVSMISFRWDGPFWFPLKVLHFFSLFGKNVAREGWISMEYKLIKPSIRFN